MRSLFLVALLTACTAGEGKVDADSDADADTDAAEDTDPDGDTDADTDGDTDTDADGDTDTDADGDTDSDTDADTDGDTDTDPGEDLSGRWTGDVVLEVPGWTWTVCEGPLEMVVGTSGRFTADSGCVNPDTGVRYPLQLTGEVGSDGAVRGENTFVFTYEDGSTATFGGTVWGTAAGDEMALEMQTLVTDDAGEPFITVDGRAAMVR
jgi:hypothetical protein